MRSVNRIHHIAVAVDDIEKSLAFWRDTLGLSLSEVRDVPREKTQVAFLPVGGSAIELVKPTTDDSGLAKFLARRGPGMHHICLEVDDMESMLVLLKTKGVRLVNETSALVNGRKYAFVHPESTGGVLVELYEIRKSV